MTDLELKCECVNRLRILGLMSDCVNAFEKDNKVWKSEFDGILYELNADEQKIVNDFEKENNCRVYHIVKSYTEFGTILNLLYVDRYKYEWQYFYEDLKQHITMVYAENLENEMFSEFGSIVIQSVNGGLKRVG